MAKDKKSKDLAACFLLLYVYYYFAERYQIRSTLECSVENKSGGLNEPRHEKTCLRGGGLQPGYTQTGLRSHRRYVEAWNFGYKN